MNKIKVVGVLIFLLSIFLALLFNYISTQNRANITSLGVINEQKSYTQEISKSILYLHRNRGGSSKELDINIEKFLENKSHKEEGINKNDAVVKLWNEFYLSVEKFKEQQKVTTTYGSMVTEEVVNNIYNKNLKLIMEFDKFINQHQKDHCKTISIYKNIQYLLFFILISLLIYLFTQVREVIAFIQKFTTTSENIIQSSTIQGLEPIEEIEADEGLIEATKNFNHLVDKINSSIEYSTKSIEHTTEALEEVEKNIEDFISLLSKMQDEEGEELSQKEDVVIDSLDTLMNLTDKLTNIKKDLEKLIKC